MTLPRVISDIILTFDELGAALEAGATPEVYAHFSEQTAGRAGNFIIDWL